MHAFKEGALDLLIAGEWPHDDNPLVNAPHTLGRCTADEWTHPYSRWLAAYPAGRSTGQLGPADSQKYWPWSARIDNAYGDRHLMCTCPPVADYVQ